MKSALNDELRSMHDALSAKYLALSDTAKSLEQRLSDVSQERVAIGYALTGINDAINTLDKEQNAVE